MKLSKFITGWLIALFPLFVIIGFIIAFFLHIPTSKNSTDSSGWIPSTVPLIFFQLFWITGVKGYFGNWHNFIHRQKESHK